MKGTVLDHVRPLRSYGRIGGRPLSDRQKILMRDEFSRLSISIGDADSGSRSLIEDIDPIDLFENSAQVWIEIGFGGAEHLIAQARANPAIGFLGAEPFLEGVAKAVAGCVDHELKNVRLHAGDVRALMQRLVSGSISRIFIMFPDPWPKRRHWKRRLIQPAFVAELARLLTPGGQVRFATDVMSYADEALFHFTQSPDFEWIVSEAQDWRAAPADHVRTRYEAKRLGDCEPVFLHFRRRLSD